MSAAQTMRRSIGISRKQLSERHQFYVESKRPDDLRLINSLNFEPLKGDKKGLFSVRANGKQRIQFTIDENLDTPVLTVCNITDLSNHYKQKICYHIYYLRMGENCGTIRSIYTSGPALISENMGNDCFSLIRYCFSNLSILSEQRKHCFLISSEKVLILDSICNTQK